MTLGLKSRQAPAEKDRGLLRDLFSLLNRRERWQAFMLSLAMIVQAGAELVGVASIAPFMSVVADPSIVQRNEILHSLYEVGGFRDTTAFLSVLGMAAVVLLALSNSFSAMTQWATLRFSWDTNHRLGVRMLEGYLSRPYEFFVNHNTARLHKNILSEVSSAVNGVLQPLMTLVARGLVTLAIIGLLVYADPLLAAIVVVVLGGAYGSMYVAVRKKQAKLGKIRVRSNQERFKVSSEAFGGIKDIKVLQREPAFIQRFKPASLRFSRAVASNGVIRMLPRYVFETIAFGGLLLIVIYYLRAGEGLSTILPILSLYAFAGYRLMPSLQQLFAAATSIRFQRAALEDLLEDLPDEPLSWKSSADVERLPLRDEIHVEQVTFRYSEEGEPALDEVTLTVPCNATVGLVGESGSGKTTLADLLLGLYTPEGGQIRVDGVVLDSTNLGRWRRQVGYIPQYIFLCDDSIAGNIAFGLSSADIDLKRVKHVAHVAHLHDFIETLPKGYDTLVGERGVRLSGGQRQRIGIARALYHDPAVLVMDEATSALDGVTEDAVMEAVRDLAGRKTIILIAHRLSTVEQCDCIFLLKDGRLVDAGTYQELLSRSPSFRAMAKIDSTRHEPV